MDIRTFVRLPSTPTTPDNVLSILSNTPYGQVNGHRLIFYACAAQFGNFHRIKSPTRYGQPLQFLPFSEGVPTRSSVSCSEPRPIHSSQLSQSGHSNSISRFESLSHHPAQYVSVSHPAIRVFTHPNLHLFPLPNPHLFHFRSLLVRLD